MNKIIPKISEEQPQVEVQPNFIDNNQDLEKPSSLDSKLWNYLNEEEQPMPTAEYSNDDIHSIAEEIESNPIYQQEMAQQQAQKEDDKEKDMSLEEILKRDIEDPVSGIIKESQKQEGAWEQITKSLLTKEGITKTVKDMPATVLKGTIDTIGSVSDFLKFVNPWDPLDNVFERISNNADLKSEELGKEMNIINNAISSVIIPYGAAYGVAAKVAPSAFKIGKFGIKNYLKFTGKQALVGGVISFVLDDPKQDNLVTMLQDSDTTLGKVLPAALANDDDDNEFVSRMKNAMVGAGTDAAISALVEPAVHLYRFLRNSKKTAQSPAGQVLKRLPPYKEKEKALSLPPPEQFEALPPPNMPYDIRPGTLEKGRDGAYYYKPPLQIKYIRDIFKPPKYPALPPPNMPYDIPHGATVRGREGAFYVRPDRFEALPPAQKYAAFLKWYEKNSKKEIPLALPPSNVPKEVLPGTIAKGKDGVFYARPDRFEALPPAQKYAAFLKWYDENYNKGSSLALPPSNVPEVLPGTLIKGEDGIFYARPDQIEALPPAPKHEAFLKWYDEKYNKKAPLALPSPNIPQDIAPGSGAIKKGKDDVFYGSYAGEFNVIFDKIYKKEVYNQQSDLLKFSDQVKNLGEEGVKPKKRVAKKTSAAKKLRKKLLKDVDANTISVLEKDKILSLTKTSKNNKLKILGGARSIAAREIFEEIYNMNSPFLIYPTLQENEDGNLRLQVGLTLRPFWMDDVGWFKMNKGLRNHIRKNKGRISYSKLKTINKAIVKETRAEIAASGISTKPSRPQRQAKLISSLEQRALNREFKKMTRDFNVFPGKHKELAETLMNEAHNFNVGRNEFDFSEFAAVTKQAESVNGAIKNSPELAVVNYLKHIQPVAGQQFERMLPESSTTLLSKSNIERGADERIGITKVIGQYRSASMDEFVSETMSMYSNTVHELASMYKSNQRLKRAGIYWPRKMSLNTKPELPSIETEQVIALYEQAKVNVLALISDQVAFRKATSAQGVDLQNLKPDSFQSLYILNELKKQHKPGELINIFSKYGVGLDEGLTLEINPKTGNKEITLRETFKAVPERAMDLIIENLISQASTAMLVTKAGILHTAGDLMLRSFIRDMQGVVKYGIGSVTGDGWLKLSGKAEMGEFKRNFDFYLQSILPAFSDMGAVLAGRVDANTLAYNLGDKSFALDAFKGIGNMQKLLKKYKQTKFYTEAKEKGAMQGFAFAQAPEFVLNGLNTVWGIGKLQGIDAFFKRLWGPAMIEKYARQSALQEISERVAISGKIPSQNEISQEISERVLIAQDRFKMGLKDDVVDMALDELNKGLFRSTKTPVAGTEGWNVGGEARKLVKIFKDIPGAAKPFGRVASAFSEVVINSADYFVQRVPGLNFINPTIRAEWNSYAKPEVIAKSLSGLSIGLTGWLLYLKYNGLLDVTDSFDERKRYSEVNGFFPHGDLVIQTPIFGKRYVIPSLIPVGEQLSYGAVMANYFEKFREDKDFANYMRSVVGKTAEKVLPVDLFSQFSGFFEFFKELKESEENGFKAIGATTQQLLDVGLLKEIKDFRRGFKLKQDRRKGVISEDLSSVKKESVFFDISRVKQSVLPITDWDRNTVPDYDWRGHEITVRKDSGLGSIDDYFAFISKLKGFEKDKVSQVLWSIQQDAESESLKLNPNDSFSVKDMYLSQMLSTLKKDKKRFLDMKNVLDSPEYKTDKQWRFNNQQHRLLKKLSAGKPVSVSVIHKGKEKEVKLDLQRELKEMAGLKIGEKFRSNEYALLRKHQEAFKILHTYGASKEKAVSMVINDSKYEKIRTQVSMINNVKPPLNWIELRENIQKGMEVGKFQNVMKENPSYETPEGRFMFNRLVDEFEQGQFEGSGDRKKEARKNMRIAINNVAAPYNDFAKTVFLFKVLGQSDVFLQKLFKPEVDKATAKFNSGEYDYSRFTQ